MGICSSQKQKLNTNRPIIRLIRIKMESQSENYEFIITQWKQIYNYLRVVQQKHSISGELNEISRKINCHICNNKKSPNFSATFFELFDQFQQFLTEEVMRNEPLWNNNQKMFKHLDLMNENFVDQGFSSKVLTQSLTKY